MVDIFEDILASAAPRICVMAAPGSGKTTRVLIPKATKVLVDPTIDPKHVLLLTFSRLSAIDLKAKVKSMDRIPRASTVHSLCLSFLLSEDNHEIRKRIESILLDFQTKVLVADLKLVFPWRPKPKLKKDLEEFSAGWATQPHDKVFEATPYQKDFKAAVRNWLSEHEAAMMDEIVYSAVDLAGKLTSPAFILEPQYIFLDEAQDLNRLEQEFIYLLAKESKLLLVVGDPDQSIYSFKYAHPTGVEQFAAGPEVKPYKCNVTGRCAKSIVSIANQLLKQATPERTDLLVASKPGEGEVHFVRKQFQPQEFRYAVTSIALRLKQGGKPDDIIILTPRKILAHEFTDYANRVKALAGIPEEIRFTCVLKREFSEVEQTQILLLALLVKPQSLLYARTFIGLNDEAHWAEEIRTLKTKYGDLSKALAGAIPGDFPASHSRVRKVCERAVTLRTFIANHPQAMTVDSVLDELFPHTTPELQELRAMFDDVREQDDDVSSLFGKFVDYVRTLPIKPNSVRVMTLMASKGLEADHVYILGCNRGNIPGTNRSTYLSDYEHNREQRRLLYVGVTRARESLTVSWSRYLPYRQSMKHATAGVGVVKINGKLLREVGLSEFLQELTDITWET
jgi:DNA helicase-2/ATP-dependent DNA helicase PcrA